MILRAAAALTLAVVLILVPVAGTPAAAQSATTAATSSEAWYSRADACDDQQLDCSLLPPPDAYPEHTLHVGITAGNTTAETYLELDTTTLPDGADITGGTLTLPVNTDPDAGSLRAPDAALTICLVTEFIPSSHGSLGTPPEYDCDTAATPARFRPQPKPHFTADLAPLATHWATGDSPRLAVLPAPEANKAADSWHVAFWGNKHDTGDAITAEFTHETSENDLTPDLGTTPPVNPASGAEPQLPTVASPAPSLDGLAPEAAQPPDIETPTAAEPPAPNTAPAPQAAPVYRTVGYPYPIRWTMPLIMLIIFGVTGRALTKRLEPQV